MSGAGSRGERGVPTGQAMPRMASNTSGRRRLKAGGLAESPLREHGLAQASISDPSPRDCGDRRLPSEAPSTWPSVRGVPGHQYTLLGTAPETLRTHRSPNEPPQETGRIRFCSIFMIEGHGCRTSAAWRPGRPPPAQKSSKAAATVLCPKMKVPTSTETAPHTSKQHLPGRYTHVNALFPGPPRRQAEHSGSSSQEAGRGQSPVRGGGGRTPQYPPSPAGAGFQGNGG